MSEGTALTHLHCSLNIRDLARQFWATFSTEWIAGRRALTAALLHHIILRTAGFKTAAKPHHIF